MLSNDAKHEVCQLLWTIGDGSFLPRDIDRLEQLTSENPELQNVAIEFAAMYSMLHWEHHRPESSNTAGAAKAVSTSQPSTFPLLTTTLHGAIAYFSSGWPVAYMIATVIFGVGLLIGSLVPVSQPAQVARQSSVPSRVDAEPKTQLVGRITGMVDCKWGQGPGSRVQSRVLTLDSRLSSRLVTDSPWLPA